MTCILQLGSTREQGFVIVPDHVPKVKVRLSPPTLPPHHLRTLLQACHEKQAVFRALPKSKARSHARFAQNTGRSSLNGLSLRYNQ